MNEQLAISAEQLGTPPDVSASLGATVGLVPAKDMTENVATMHVSLDALRAARAALAQARLDGLAVVDALRG